MLEIIGKIVDIVPTLERTVRVTIETDGLDAAEGLEGLATPAPGGTAPPKLRVRIARARKGRSLDANAYFWACVQILASATRQSKDDVYIQLLRRYGVYTPLVVREDALDRLRSVWREIEVLGDTTTETGAVGKSVLAYYGSSTYDSREMSRLIEGTVSEIQEMGLTAPPTRDMEELLKNWEKERG